MRDSILGRRTTHKPEYNKQAYRLCLLGATDKDLAAFFQVTEQTINNWKKDHKDFFESLKDGKEIADAKVGEKLFQRATGYEHQEDKVFCNSSGEVTVVPTTKHYAPDPTSMIFWLKNRRPDLWRDRVEHTGADGKDLIPEMTDAEIARRALFAMTKMLKDGEES